MNRRCFDVYTIASVVVLLLLSTTGLLAQRYVDVQAGFTLQNVIVADSANRVANPNTIYLVHRGTDSLYVFSATLTNWGSMPLQIQSVGTGPLPHFKWLAQSNGATVSPLISAKANLLLKGVFLDGVNYLNTPVDRMIRIQATGVTVTVDSCQASRSTQSFIRVDNGSARIFLKNCRVSNVYSDWANARGVDNRGITIDTLSVVNCTFFRVGQRIYRDGAGILTYGYFNHNTFVDIGQGLLALGAANNVVFKNNLVYNAGFLGQGQSSQTGRLLSITPIVGQATYVANNVLTADSTIMKAAFAALGDTVKFIPWFADTINTMIAAQGLQATNISSPVAFTMAPNSMPNVIATDSIARWYWRNYAATPTPSTADASMLKADSLILLNLAYSTSAPAYTFATDGKPAGSVEWFGMTVGVRNESSPVAPSSYSLDQNFPNPFNPSTRISYTLATDGQVRLEVFNLLGQSIRTLLNGRQQAGTHVAEWNGRDNAGNFAPSGVYLYRLQGDGVSMTKKMVLMK